MNSEVLLIFGFVGLYLSLILISVLKNRYDATGSLFPKTLEEFFLASRSLSPTVLMITYLGTFNSSLLLIGIPSLAYKKGAIFVFEFWLSFVLGAVIAFFIAKKFWQLAKEKNLLSPIEILSCAYNSKKLGRFAAIIFLIPLLSYLSMQLAGLGVFLQGLSGGVITYNAGIGGVSIVLLIYALLGGMRAIAMTDVVQVGAIYLGIACLAIFTILVIWPEEGVNWEIFISKTQSHLSLVGVNGTYRLEYILFGISGLFPIIFQPHLLSRWMMASKASQPWKMNLTVVLGLSFAFPMMVLLALTAFIVLPPLDNANTVSGEMLSYINNLGLLGMIVSILFSLGVLGAAMSTADSLMLSISQITTRDILSDLAKPVFKVKIIMFTALATAFLVGMNPPALVADFVFYAIKATASVVPAYLGVFWVRRNALAAALSILSGLIALLTMIILNQTPFGLNDGFITLMISSVVYVGTANYMFCFQKKQK